MDLSALQAFVLVAELGSFTRAAERLGQGKSRVSEAVSRLEAQLGARLLQRTTRRLRLTPDGEQLLERGQALLAEAQALNTLFRPEPGAAGGLTGRLRVDLPTRLARELVIPQLPGFLAQHPQLALALGTSDRQVDLVQEGHDCVLRVGALAPSELVARPLGALAMCNAASPAYLRTHGTPATLADLAGHAVIHYAGSLDPRGAGWDWLDAQGVAQHLPMTSRVVVNGTDAYEAACLAGLGLIQAPLHGLRHHLAAGRLVAVLPAHVSAPLPVTLLMPHRRHVPMRVRAFMDWLAQALAPALQVQG